MFTKGNSLALSVGMLSWSSCYVNQYGSDGEGFLKTAHCVYKMNSTRLQEDVIEVSRVKRNCHGASHIVRVAIVLGFFFIYLS